MSEPRSDDHAEDLRGGEEPAPPEPARRARTVMLIAATREQVFEVLSDGSSYAEWVVGANQIDAEDAAFPAVGSEIQPEVGFDVAKKDGTTEVTGVETARSLQLLATVEPLGQARIGFQLEDAPGGTLVVMEEEAVGDDLAARAGRRATRAVRARNAETLWRLKVLVERRAGRSDDLRSSTHRASAVPDVIAAGTARVFAWASGLRNDRVFHPRGVSFAGTARLAPGSVGRFGDREELEALVRVSRGIGLPHPLPDFNGVAVRLLDAHGEGRDQDLLLVSAPMPPVARHALVPSPFLGWTGYSSILPYRTPDGLRMYGARRIDGRTIEGLGADLPSELVVVGAPLLGGWEPVVRITLTEELDHAVGEAVRFDPWNTGDQLVPAGFFNRLRLPAYAASQAARRP